MGSLYTYSLVRALYDNSRDYIDAFWPFVLKVLPEEGTPKRVDELQSSIQAHYRLHIPQHSLTIILTRAVRTGLVERSHGKVGLTVSGREHLKTLELERSVERRIGELVQDAKIYLRAEHGLGLSTTEVEEGIFQLIRENIVLFEQFIHTEDEATMPDKLSKELEVALFNFFLEVERVKPTIFRTLHDIVCGSIISSVVNNHNLLVEQKTLQTTVIYIDTNFALRLLELDHDQNNITALELMDLMKKDGRFVFRIFDFTVSELVALLKSAGSQMNSYIQGIHVQALASSLKNKGWSQADIVEYIAQIEGKLKNMSVDVEQTQVDIENYRPSILERRATLQKYKPQQGVIGQNHDLAAIDIIKKRRGRYVRRIEEAKAFFLTQDIRLAEYCVLEEGHKHRGTVGEVVHERVLTNILWLANPTMTGDLPLKSVISMHSNHLFIDNRVWQALLRTVNKLREQGVFTDQDVTLFLYDQSVREALQTHDLGNKETFETDWLVTSLEQARGRVEKEGV
jgi:hypothetical protein